MSTPAVKENRVYAVDEFGVVLQDVHLYSAKQYVIVNVEKLTKFLKERKQMRVPSGVQKKKRTQEKNIKECMKNWMENGTPTWNTKR